MTNVALSAMFEASPPAGYESLYFDRCAGELRGGIRKYLGRRTPDKIPSSYMDDLDYQEPSRSEFLIYVAPDRVWRADMQRFRERFRAAPQNRDYFAFLKATDGLLHAQGPERLNVALESLDKILKEIQKYCGAETEIVLFSDRHESRREPPRRSDNATSETRFSSWFAADRRQWSRAEFRRLVYAGYAAVYSGGEEFVPGAARAIVDIEGVDFVVYRDGSAVAVEGQRGNARIDRRGDSYRYVSKTGDPLELDAMVGDGFLEDSVLFEKTNAHRYPDVLTNLYKSLFTPRVKHTADILISLKDGYYYGWSPFGRFVRLAATHGNALRSSSNAFLMSTHRKLPGCVRADDARKILRG